MNNPAENAGLGSVISSYRFTLISVGVFSAVVNLLLLTGPIFMLQVYDRVLASQSVPTLLMLILLVGCLLIFYALLECIRLRILARVGAEADALLCTEVFRRTIGSDPTEPNRKQTSPVRDLETVRQFLSGPAPLAAFDLPWLPLFLGVVYLLHFWLGVTATIGAIVLFALAVLNEFMMRGMRQSIASGSIEKQTLLAAAQRHRESLRALGMVGTVAERWRDTHSETVALQTGLSDVSGGFSSLIKGVRLFLQSLILGVGAYLAIHQQVSPGAMIAASIIAARALAPLELAVSHWRQYGEVAEAFPRLRRLFDGGAQVVNTLSLPAPKRDLSVDDVSYTPPNAKHPVLHGIHFHIEAGTGLAVLGPSASGKSTLARLLAGLLPDHAGDVRLDGATFDQWNPDQLGRHIGYLSQHVALLPGTIAENISRFRTDADTRKIIDAAALAGVHELILNLPNGYETRCDETSFELSAGQRQRIALARALYDDPFLIVLDEANSNLDAEGESALVSAIRNARNRGAIVIAMAHRPSILAAVDRVLLLGDGRQHAFGEKENVLATYLRPASEGRNVA